MMKILLAGAAAFALTAGPAFAQTAYTESTTSVQSTTTPATPGVDSTFKSTRSKSIQSDGTETVKHQTYAAGRDGVRATSNSRTIAPDGSEVTTSHDEKVVTPGADTTTTRSTTTTTRTDR